MAGVEALLEAFGSRGARMVREPCLRSHGVLEGVVTDLDGHRLAFGQKLD